MTANGRKEALKKSVTLTFVLWILKLKNQELF